MLPDQQITAESVLADIEALGKLTKTKIVHEDLKVIVKRIKEITNMVIEQTVINDYLLAVSYYLQAVDIRRRNDKVTRFTHLPKEQMVKVAFLFVYDPRVETNYLAPAVEPMRDFLAISTCVKLPHEVQVGIFHVLSVGANLNKHYMRSKDGRNEKTEETLTKYCEAIDRMTASALALSLRGVFDNTGINL